MTMQRHSSEMKDDFAAYDGSTLAHEFEEPTRKKRSLEWMPGILRLLGVGMLLLAIVMLVPVAAPRIAGFETYAVETASMDPTIPVGALVVVQPEGAADLVEGDIVAYQRGDVVIVHRVVANQVVEGYLTTKGDANELEDQEPVRYESVIGTVVFSVPYLGTFGGILTTIEGKSTSHSSS